MSAVAAAEGVRRPAVLAAALILAALAVVALPHIGAAPRPVDPHVNDFTGQTTAQARAAGRAALSLVDVAPEELSYKLVFATGRRQLRGMTDTGVHRITVFVRPGDAPHVIAHDIAHEMGHAYDARFMDGAARQKYLERRGRPTASWWPSDDLADDYATGAGDFAEVFASCHAASPVFRSHLAAVPQSACSMLPARPRA